MTKPVQFVPSGGVSTIFDRLQSFTDSLQDKNTTSTRPEPGGAAFFYVGFFSLFCLISPHCFLFLPFFISVSENK